MTDVFEAIAEGLVEQLRPLCSDVRRHMSFKDVAPGASYVWVVILPYVGSIHLLGSCMKVSNWTRLQSISVEYCDPEAFDRVDAFLRDQVDIFASINRYLLAKDGYPQRKYSN